MVKKNRFIRKNDIWGIKKLIFELYNKNKPPPFFAVDEANGYLFDVFFNQFIPPTWRETKKTVRRHLTEIKHLLKGNKYSPKWVWIKRNNQLKCGIWNSDLVRMIKNKEVQLPTYIEIEEEKMRWQKNPTYNKENGFSQPIKEEVIQLRLFKRG